MIDIKDHPGLEELIKKLAGYTIFITYVDNNIVEKIIKGARKLPDNRPIEVSVFYSTKIAFIYTTKLEVT